MTRKRKNSARY